MALLESPVTHTRFHLPAQCLVGRAAHCNLRLSSRLASSVHAEIRWTGRAWELRDLSSRNGTFVDRQQVADDERVELREGMALAFGDPDAAYRVTSTAPPVARARAGGDVREAENGLLLLPDDDAPEHTIFEDPPGRWWTEDRGGARHALHDGQFLHGGGRRWTLELPLATEITQQPGADHVLLEQVALRVAVSRDQEYIEVALVAPDRDILLPARAHNELLLALARARLQDQENAAISARDAGWRYTDELRAALDIDYNLLNQHKSRARKQLAEARVIGAARLFELRPSTRQIRLGIGRVEIVSL